MPLPITPSGKSGFSPVNTDFNTDFESDLAELLLKDSPFDDQISNQLGKVDFKAGTTGSLTFGSDDVAKFGLTASSGVTCNLLLKRAENESLGLLDKYLPADIDYGSHLLLSFSSVAQAGIEANATAKFGAYLGLSGGAEASGELGYHRCIAFPRTESARIIIQQFLANLRWPLSSAEAHRGLLSHDIAAVDFRGKLKLWGDVSVGYSVSGSKGISVKNLEASFNYKLEAALRLGGSFELGGSFLLVSSPGTKPDWVRLRVERASNRSSEVHFGFDLKFTYDTAGVPASAAGLLTALTGYDTTNVIKWLETAAGAENADGALALVKAKFGEQAKKSAGALMDTVFRSNNFQNKKAKIDAVVSQYADFKTEVDSRILDLARKHIRTAETITTLKTVLAKTTREGLTEISDASTWQLIDDLIGDKAYELLLDQEVFTNFRSKTQKLLDLLEGKGTYKPVRDFIEELEDRFNVDKLITALSDALDEDKLRDIVNGKMGELTTILFDFAKNELNGTGVDKLVQRVSETAQEILALEKKLSAMLKDGLKNKLEISLLESSASSRASSTLLDMEFNLAEEGGRALFDTARKGDFTAAIKAFDPSLVLVRKGEFQKSLEKSRNLQVHAFGWTNSFEVKIEQKSKVDAVMQDGGPIFLLSSDTSQTIRQVSGFDAKETVQSVLQLGIQARASADQTSKDEILTKVIDSMRCSCSVVREQKEPSWDELSKAFRLAEQLGLIGDSSELIRSLEVELGPQKPKKVSVSYGVSYNPDAFSALWLKEFGKGSPDRAFVSQTFRSLLLDRWAFDHPGFFSPENALKYLNCKEIIQLPKVGRGGGSLRRYKIIGHDDSEEIVSMSRDVLYQASRSEAVFLSALERLDDACDRAREDVVLWNELNSAVEGFLGVPRSKHGYSAIIWKGNLFFLTLDAMLLLASADARKGKTVLQLDIVPQTGEPVRRFYS